MPTPKDEAEVQRFLGIQQYLEKICHNLSEHGVPLRDFARETSEFHSSRNLQVDASEDAIGDVLLLNDQPVCFTSHTLNNTEYYYAQIEKECLAIVSCMDNWHQYLY